MKYYIYFPSDKEFCECETKKEAEVVLKNEQEEMGTMDGVRIIKGKEIEIISEIKLKE
jgi:hypothetical protein